MKRSTLCGAVVAIASMAATVSFVAAADLTNPDQPKMPATSEFGTGPQGGGASLSPKDHIPSPGEFGTGPKGGTTADPVERRMPGTGEFGTGPTGISPDKK